MQNTEQQLVAVGVVADAIGIGPATVRRWAREGRIPSIRLSTRTLRFDLAEVMAALPRKMPARGTCR